jgi:SAM-dependent methyltransferase
MDVVLEIGCRTGETTAVIAQHCGEVVGIDGSSDSIGQARLKHSNIEFETIDGFNLRAVLALGKTFSHVYVCMSEVLGRASVLDALSLLNVYAAALNTKCIVVHSATLRDLAWRSYAFDAKRSAETGRPILEGSIFVGTRGLHEYRASVPHWVTRDDVVLEIGCE